MLTALAPLAHHVTTPPLHHQLPSSSIPVSRCHYRPPATKRQYTYVPTCHIHPPEKPAISLAMQQSVTQHHPWCWAVRALRSMGYHEPGLRGRPFCLPSALFLPSHVMSCHAEYRRHPDLSTCSRDGDRWRDRQGDGLLPWSRRRPTNQPTKPFFFAFFALGDILCCAAVAVVAAVVIVGPNRPSPSINPSICRFLGQTDVVVRADVLSECAHRLST